LKATKYLAVLSVILLGSASAVSAAPHWEFIAGRFLGEASKVSSKDDRTACEKLLRSAREAMKANNLPVAEKLLQEAESMDVEFSVLYVGDTPKKLKRDLEANRAVAKAAAKRPSQVAQPSKPLDSAASAPSKPESMTRPGGKADSVQMPTDEPERLPNMPSKALSASRDPFGRATVSSPPATDVTDVDLPKGEVLRGVKGESAPAGSRSAPNGRLGQTAAPIQAAVPASKKSIDNSARANDAMSAVYNPQNDPTSNRLAAVELPADTLENAAPLDVIEQVPTQGAMDLVQQGEQALRSGNKDEALDYFRRAYKLRDQLDPATAKSVQGHLQLLAAPAQIGKANDVADTLIEDVAKQQKQVQRQLASDVVKQQEAARKMLEKDPKGAVAAIREAQTNVRAAKVDQQFRATQLAKLDRTLAEFDKFISDHRAQIEADDANKSVLEEVDRRRKHRQEVQTKLSSLVDEYNRLSDEKRYEEAELLARKARELDPENPLAIQLVRESMMIRNFSRQTDLQERKEKGFSDTMLSVDEAAVPTDPNNPFQYDAKKWGDLVARRSGKYGPKQRLNERELEIKRKLTTPVEVRFNERPLGEVLTTLANMAGVNLHIDETGLIQEGLSLETPVSLNLTHEVMLKSALQILLEQRHLTYLIKNEVLNITSESKKAGDLYTVTYNVADLIVPIPNFPHNASMGLAGAYQDAQAHQKFATPKGVLAPTTLVTGAAAGPQGANGVDAAILQQIRNNGAGSSGGSMANGPGIGPGPGGAGGGAQADFDQLIELITSTISPSTWDEVGGPGAIQEFRGNFSLVVSQTQDVHDQIVDLLDQLRRLQDLQVTIEVRFITLNDRFFERIGVDFQFNVETNTTPVNVRSPSPSATVGLSPDSASAGQLPTVTTNNELQFRQGSFGLALPSFGGFDTANSAAAAGRFGFAILSDIEAYFLLTAAQADTRSNVLQAPKVTLFNGQQASVSDTTQMPFVISVTPVVGDFAAAQQPVIVVLSEGTFLTVQAVVSANRQYVRLTVVPFFSTIGHVDTFTFQGTKTTTKGSTSSSNTGGNNGTTAANGNNETTTTEGITLQLPTFSFVSVSTTVSVPDGGTVLLGGIKRLSEGRSEVGVPILSKLPYINRLFKNVGIGRDTQSLMMMVTPRIIIQEEEEARLGIQP
jgi:general secretion pathway protein D